MKVKHTKDKGNGVFAEKNYPKDKLILRHEILPVPASESAKIQKTFLDNYMFMMGGIFFMALGEGSLLNHCDDPNVYYTFRKKTRQIEFYSLRKIKKGEELTIDYEWDSYPWKKSKTTL